MTERFLKNILNANAAALCLVFMAIQVLLYGVQAAVRESQLSDLFWICLAGALVGLWGGTSRWTGWRMSVVAVAVGIAGVWMIASRTGGPLFELVRSLIDAGPQILPQLSYRLDVDASGIVSAWNSIGASSSALLSRWQAWVTSATNGTPVNDALIRNMYWTFALWLISIWIGWFAGKRNGMVALLPGILLLALLLGRDELRVESLWALVMIMLLLMGLWNYQNHKQSWEKNQIDYSDSIRIDAGQYILAVAVVVGLFSYVTPSYSWRDVRDYFRERERKTEAAASPSDDFNAAPQPGLITTRSSMPREHLLTAGQAQSEKIVMTIDTGELQPNPMPGVTVNAPRYYWRSVIYDRYDGRGWSTTAAPSQSVSASEPLIAGLLREYKHLHLNVQMQQPDGKLYWTGMLYSASIPLRVDWRLKPTSNLFADQSDLLQADMFAAHTDAAAYDVDAFLPIASIQQLRAAPDDVYPEHIRDRYLLLPESIPQRVHELAREITSGHSTPYDKAAAIETYLRTNYPYDLEIAAPPENRDVADYFLFDLQRGYCDYYATAMVVLARSGGLPARFVSGYARGEYDAANAHYVIRELHAHSWVEVYFPEIGWVEFEPTGNQPEIERDETNLSQPADRSGESTRTNIYVQLTDRMFIPLAVVLIAVILYFVWAEQLLFSRIHPAVAIQMVYQRFYRAGRPLAGTQTRAETAHEFMSKLTSNIQRTHAPRIRSLQNVQNDIQELTAIYQDALFSNHDIASHDVRRARDIWKRLRWSLLFERIKRFFRMRNKANR